MSQYGYLDGLWQLVMWGIPIAAIISLGTGIGVGYIIWG